MSYWKSCTQWRWEMPLYQWLLCIPPVRWASVVTSGRKGLKEEWKLPSGRAPLGWKGQNKSYLLYSWEDRILCNFKVSPIWVLRRWSSRQQQGAFWHFMILVLCLCKVKWMSPKLTSIWGALQSFVFQAVTASLCSLHCFGSYIVWILAVRKEWLHILPFSTHRGRSRKAMRSSPLWAVMRPYKTKKQYTPK